MLFGLATGREPHSLMRALFPWVGDGKDSSHRYVDQKNLCFTPSHTDQFLLDVGNDLVTGRAKAIHYEYNYRLTACLRR
jgi:hypothetical protein